MAGGLFSHYQQTAQKQYASNPANFAVGQNKVWEELSPSEKASSLFKEYGKKTADFAGEVAVGMKDAVTETAVGLADVALRTSPIETVRNIGSGIQEVAKRQPGVPMGLAYEKGVFESKARPLMLEKLTGQQLKNPDGSVNWDFARKFVGRTMEAPTYAYAGAVKGAELVGKGLLSRIITRTASTIPEAGINTGLQAFEDGSTENAGVNFLANALLMSGVSNVVGEIKLPKDILNKTVSDIEVQVGKLTPEQKIDVQDALKQGVKSEEILTNLQKVVKNEVTPDEVATKVNAAVEPPKVETPEVKVETPQSPLLQEAGKYKSAEEFVDAKVFDKTNPLPTADQAGFLKTLSSEEKTVVERLKDIEFRRASLNRDAGYKPNVISKEDTAFYKENVGKYKKRFNDYISEANNIKSQLTDLYNKAQGGALKTEPKTVEVPRSQMPVGTGQEKVSRLEARMTGNLGKLTPEQIDEIGLSTYKQMNRAEQKTAAIDYVTKNPDDALKIISGEMEPPKGILKNSIYVAMDALGHEDQALALKIASAASTRGGQELNILKELSADSPVTAMREVSDARIQATEKRLKSGSVAKTRNEITGTAKKTVDKTVTRAIKEDWNNFVDAIKCK